MLAALNRLLLSVCLLGMVAAALIHIYALALSARIPTAVIVTMHAGLFVVAMPTILVVRRVTDDVRPKDLLKLMRSTCPKWLARVSAVVGIYWVVVFILFAVTEGRHRTSGATMPSSTLAMFSAGWMAFYAGLANYLYLGMSRVSIERRCPSGHVVGAAAQYCEVCGTPLK